MENEVSGLILKGNVDISNVHSGNNIYFEAELNNFLHRLVDISDSVAGILFVWEERRDRGGLRFYSVGLERSSGDSLVSIVRDFAIQVRNGEIAISTEVFSNNREIQRELETTAQSVGLGKVYACIMPVVVGDEPSGVLCLFNRQDLPSFLHRYSRMYKIVLDRIEVTLRHASLLSSLVRERSWFETIVNKTIDGVAIVDRDGNIIGVNPVMEKLSGWNAAEMAGLPVYKVLPLSIEANTGPERSLVLYSEQNGNFPVTSDPVEAVLTDRSGQKIDVEVVSLRVRDMVGKSSGSVLTFRDIRKRKETERLGKIFLSAMSHELQTPIAVIKGFAGLMSDPEIELSRETILQKSQVILDESERLQKMVRQMLEAASIQAGGIVLHCEAVDIDSMIERTLRRLEKHAEDKDIKLRSQIEKKGLTIWGDLSRLEQVITNLVENAIKYSSEGEVLIRVTGGKREITISVIDEGPGVNQEESKRIFGLFERGEETKKKIRGSGLGLFISKAIVEAHGGIIGVNNTGHGACFYFSLPIKEIR